MSKDHIEVLALTDVFTLAASTDIPQEKKAQLLDEMQAILLQDFIAHDIPALLNEEQKAQVNAAIDAQKTPAELVELIKQLIPDTEDIMYRKSIEFKKAFIKGQVKATIDIVHSRIELVQNGTLDEDLAQLEGLLDRLNEALDHYEEEKWADGLKALTSTTETI